MGSSDEVKKCQEGYEGHFFWIYSKMIPKTDAKIGFQRKEVIRSTRSARFFQSKRCHSKARIHQTAEASQIGVSSDSDLKLVAEMVADHHVVMLLSTRLETFSALLISDMSETQKCLDVCIQRMAAANQHFYCLRVGQHLSLPRLVFL